MKTTKTNRDAVRQSKWLQCAALAGLALVASGGVSHANLIVNAFDTSAEVSAYGYQNWNGSATGTESFSANQSTIANLTSTPGSGSMQISVVYGGAGQNGGTFVSSGGPYDLSQATGIEFDAMIDPSSPLDNLGNAMEIKLGFNSNIQNGANAGYTAIDDQWIGTTYAPMTLGVWQHFSATFAAGTLGTNCAQFFLQCMNYSYNGTPYTPIVYIDNIVIDEPAHPGYYPDYVGFTFDNVTSISSNAAAGVAGGTNGETTGIGWYGEPTTITWDTNQSTISNPDITPVPGSGSAHIIATYDTNGLDYGGTGIHLDNGDVIALAFDTNYFISGNFPGTDTNVLIDGTHYSAIEFDIRWDTNLSTMSITNFNSMGDIGGVPMGLLEDQSVNSGGGAELAQTEAPIPDAASNGWVHMTIPIPASTPGIGSTIGLYFKKYSSGPNGPFSGTAAYWIDNVVFDGAKAIPPSPTMSISKPVPGLNIVNNSGGGYDRESLATYNFNYTWVNQPDPVTYAMNIAAFPGVKYSGYDARIYLIPNAAATEAEPDWVEQYLAMVSVSLSAGGQAYVTIGCKNSQPNSGNGDLYDSTNPTFQTTNSPVVGQWSFTFSNNTNILVTAPDGESTNWILPLLTSDELSSEFGPDMVVYFGGYNNGSANNGQRVVFNNVAITNGSTTLLYDNFLADTQIDYVLTGGSTWVQASDGSKPESEYLVLTNTTTKYYVDWTVPATGFYLETNYSLTAPGGWSTNNPGVSWAQFGDHFHAELDVTNLPAGGDLFFRLNNTPTQ